MIRRSPASDCSIDFALGLIALVAVALLDFADQLVTRAGQPLQVLVGEFAPLLLRPAFELFPVTFDLIPIHYTLPFFALTRRSDQSKRRTADSHRQPRH